MYNQRLWVFAAVAAIAAPSFAQQVYEVDTTVDTTLGNCTAAPNDCGLRGAITAANTDGADSQIILADGIYRLGFEGANEDNNLTGDLDVRAAVEILAAPGASPVIEQTVADRVLQAVLGAGDVRIAGPITITGGQVFGPSRGGGILAEFNVALELEDVVLRSNQAAGEGGCLASFGATSVSLHRVTLTDCHAQTKGGGAWLSGGPVTITSSLIEANTANEEGGGILLSGSGGVVLDTTIRGNLAGNQFSPVARGGGLSMTGGNTVLRQSTVSGNQAGVPSTTSAEGGGIYAVGLPSLLIENSTISGNRTDGNTQIGVGILISDCFSTTLDSSSVVESPTNGMAAVVYYVLAPQTHTLKNSIIGGGCSGDTGSIVSSGFNVERPWDGSTNTTCNLTNPSDLKVTDLMLRPLAGYGGPTDTHALLPGSPAQFLVSSAQCQPEDQRHAVRAGLFCDSGAYNGSTVPPGQWIFADGFGSGDTAAWSTSVP
jgi:CSLREA domain-containing protein